MGENFARASFSYGFIFTVHISEARSGGDIVHTSQQKRFSAEYVQDRAA